MGATSRESNLDMRAVKGEGNLVTGRNGGERNEQTDREIDRGEGCGGVTETVVMVILSKPHGKSWSLHGCPLTSCECRNDLAG